MKKLLFIICIYFGSTNSYAQAIKKEIQEENSKMQIGISVGPSYTHMIGLYEYEKTLDFTPRKISYSAALHFQYNFNKTCALRTELFYEKKRIRIDGLGFGYYSYDIMFVDANKIALPVFFRANMQQFFIEAGIYFGYAHGERYTALYFSKDKKELIEKSQDYDPSNNDFFYVGACLGVGCNVINREKFSLSVSLRDDLEFITDRPMNDVRLNTINLLLGFAYKL